MVYSVSNKDEGLLAGILYLPIFAAHHLYAFHNLYKLFCISFYCKNMQIQ